jgi:membrane protein DedA with SNARE-associated domain
VRHLIDASLTTQVTSAIAHHAIWAVFVLMALDALFPVGGELVMLYAGVLAAGAVSGEHVAFLGAKLATGLESYVVLVLAGAVGYLCGALLGWTIGAGGGRTLVERHGRWLHLSPATLTRAERWFARHGRSAVFLGRLTPVVRSFISIPAGVLGIPLPSYTVLTFLGSLLWCLAFAGIGWAVGNSWETFHHSFRYADYAAVAVVVLVAAAAIVRHRRSRRALS